MRQLQWIWICSNCCDLMKMGHRWEERKGHFEKVTRMKKWWDKDKRDERKDGWCSTSGSTEGFDKDKGAVQRLEGGRDRGTGRKWKWRKPSLQRLKRRNGAVSTEEPDILKLCVCVCFQEKHAQEVRRNKEIREELTAWEAPTGSTSHL